MSPRDVSSDEGEIVESEAEGTLKAHTQPKLEGSGVDRQNRTRDRLATTSDPRWPDRSGGDRYGSRSPRGGSGRGRDERDGRGEDRRRFKIHYEDVGRRARGYEDLDAPVSRAPRDRSRDRNRKRERDRDGRDRNGYPDKRPRNRSRSPRRSKPGLGYVRDGRDRHGRAYPIKYDDLDEGTSRRDHGASRQAEVADSRRESAKQGQGHMAERPEGSAQGTGNPPVLPETDFEEPEPIDEEAEIERRRRRREELLAKSSSATPLLLQALGAPDKASPSPAPGPATVPNSDANTPNIGSPMVDVEDQLDFTKGEGGEVGVAEVDGPSAADYDPTVDMQEDERRDELRHGTVRLHGQQVSEELGKEQTGEKDEADGDDDFDMFAEDFDEDKYVVKNADKAKDGGGEGAILDGDDKDGYYKLRIGELLNGRYQVQAALGRGMFSGVARAIDVTRSNKLVAIKLMRNNDALRKGGFTEIAILQKLNDADAEDRKHIVKFERHFDYKGHLCMVFENLSMNLREVLRKFGNNVGINLAAVRLYASQIFVALAHLRKCSVIHADLKPDNILVDESRKTLKICDLGTAIDRSDAATAHNEITPYLVSRFYRAPEIILGMPYDYAVDMWSIGCTLYEMYTGKILFTGASNNQMLKAIMEIRGKMSAKIYKRGQLAGLHFDDMGRFISVEMDKALGKTTVRTMPMVKPTRDLRTRIAAAGSGKEDGGEVAAFVDLLEGCLALNPDKRLRPADALRHSFFGRR